MTPETAKVLLMIVMFMTLEVAMHISARGWPKWIKAVAKRPSAPSRRR